jgi:DNA-binding HxlR family transcriptional regulator
MSGLTVEQLLTVITAVVIPISVSTYWIASRLSSLESALRIQKEVTDLEQRQVLYRVDKLEKHVHEIRNVLQTLTFKLMRGDTLDDDFKTPPSL